MEIVFMTQASQATTNRQPTYLLASPYVLWWLPSLEGQGFPVVAPCEKSSLISKPVQRVRREYDQHIPWLGPVWVWASDKCLVSSRKLRDREIRDGEEVCPWEGPHHNGVYKAQGETGMLARLKGNANMDCPREPWPKLLSLHLHSAKACQITPSVLRSEVSQSVRDSVVLNVFVLSL